MKKIEVNKEKLGKESRGLIKEFKEFISRGNVMDLAVGVIIGGAFSNIVTSFTSILTDLLGLALGGIDFKGLHYTLGEGLLDIKYGEFLQAIFDFLIIAICIFIMIKLINKVLRKEEEKKVEPPKKADDVVLLEEIRDLLKENNKTKKAK